MTGVIQLGDSEYSVREQDGSIEIAITRTGDTTSAVNVDYQIDDDTAVSGQDYTAQVATILTTTIEAGASSATVTVPITDDILPESTETFSISLVDVDSGSLLAPRTARINILDDENPVQDPIDPPLVSNYDVSQVPVIQNAGTPIDMRFSSVDPSVVYVAEKRGVIRTYDINTGQELSTFLDISDKTNQSGDRGLLGIALHPDFQANPYVYAFYVVDPPETSGLSGNEGPDGEGNRFAYVSRFTASNDEINGVPYLTVAPGSEVVLVGGAGQSLSDISGGGVIDSTADLTQPASDVDPITGDFVEDYIKVDSASHAGGGLAFGPDGNLYVSIGDGVAFNAADPRVVSVQSENALAGKVLRIDPLTGEGLTDNPFYDGGDLTTNSSKVYQMGLRNPFRIAFDENGRLFLSETGWNTYEEINSGGAGVNFGWPYYEGADGGTSEVNAQYQALLPAESAAFIAAVTNGDVDLQAPFRAFHHLTAEPGFQFNAIVGGSGFIDGPNYPESLHNNYVFTDFNDGEVFSVDVNDSQNLNYLYTQGGVGLGPVQFITGPDGFVYTVDLVGGSVNRLLISELPFPAVILTVSPDAGAELSGTQVIVSVTASAAVSGAQSVDLALGGTGLTASDFVEPVPAVLTIADGETTASVTLTVADDAAVEGTETASFTIANPTAGLVLGPETTGTFEITDDEGQAPGSAIFRWNGGNATVSAIDGGPDWIADASVIVGGPTRVAGGTITGLDASVPVSTTPQALYNQRRWDPPVDEEMGLEIGGGALEVGSYAVRLFVGSTAWIGTDQPGDRVFDIFIEDQIVFDDFDPVLTFGHQIGGMLEWQGQITDGTVDIDFQRVAEHPNIHGVEIIRLELPAVTLSVVPGSGSETAGTEVVLSVTASAAVSGAQSVDLALGGTGLTASDFVEAVPATLTIADGETTASVTLTVADDAAVEGTETASFTIANPTAGLVLGAVTSGTFEIADNDVAPPAVTLSVVPGAGSETAGTEVVLSVTASAAVSGAQSVDLALGGAGLTASDFVEPVPAVLTIADGETTASVTLTVADDAAVEGTETASFTIANPTAGLVLGAVTSGTFEIADNDVAPPAVTLSVVPGAGSETAGTEVVLSVTASAAVSGAQSVDLALGGAGLTASDFVEAVPAVLTIADGETTASVTLTVADDAAVEGTETASFTIANPTAGLVLGAVTSGTFEIAEITLSVVPGAGSDGGDG